MAINRYFLTLAYDGSQYCGWQIQPNALSVQAVVEDNLSRLLNIQTSIVGSGRTDAGVHALGQVAHFDSPKTILDKENFVYRLNSLLPKSIVASNVWQVRPDAHARFDAQERSYKFFFHRNNTPFNQNYSVLMPKTIDLQILEKCCKIMLETSDFASFCKKGSDIAHTNCQIFAASWAFADPDTLVFEIRANRFLRGMVRATAASMLAAITKPAGAEWFRQLLNSKNRAMCPRPADAQGLFLSNITYPEEVFLD